MLTLNENILKFAKGIMANDNYIEVHIEGGKGAQLLSVDNYDIKELCSFLQNLDGLLAVGGKRSEVVLKEIVEGSVRLKFMTTLQAMAMFAATLSILVGNESLDGVEPSTAKAVEEIQKDSRIKGYSYSFSTSNSSEELRITPTSNFKRSETLWAEGEFYFYGVIHDAGGKTSANIHVDTKEFGTLKIDANKDYLRDQPRNLLYHTCGIRAKGRQNITTKEIDKDSLELISIIDFSSKYDEKYIEDLIAQATPILSAISDKQEWLNELRGR